MVEKLLLKYFVLKPEGDSRYSQASRSALKAFARSIRSYDLNIAHELEKWAKREEEAHKHRRMIMRSKV